jgi:hypothetical protein
VQQAFTTSARINEWVKKKKTKQEDGKRGRDAYEKIVTWNCKDKGEENKNREKVRKNLISLQTAILGAGREPAPVPSSLIFFYSFLT